MKAALLKAFVSTSYKRVSAATAQLDFLFCWISKRVALFGLFDLFYSFFFSSKSVGVEFISMSSHVMLLSYWLFSRSASW